MADFNSLSETEQRAVAERLLRIQESGWRPFWCKDPACDGSPHTAGADRSSWQHNHARQDQRLPAWQNAWVLMILSGRGSGKTRTGTEFVTLNARRQLDGMIVGRRLTELENTHVAALIEHAHPEFMPEYKASKSLVEWPNGAKTFLFSAERPENIRSVNVNWAWFDEAAHMDEVEKAWVNARLATRIERPGNPIHILITSTPTPTKWVMDREDDPTVEVRRVSTYANKANLSDDFIEELQREYEGTRIGRQEIYGEVLRDVEGALWTDDLFQHLRITDAAAFEELLDSMDSIVVAVDPAGSKGPRSDATGIIAVGVQRTDDTGARLAASRFYVLADGTLKGTPTEWAERVYKVARVTKADRIIAEKNYGGDMVAQVLTDYAETHTDARDPDGDKYRIQVKHAVVSKETRAEGTVGRYEQGRVMHVPNPTVYGDLSHLEKEQVNWVPKSRGGRAPSPNRVDALVWAVRELDSGTSFAAVQADMGKVREALRGGRPAGLTGLTGLGRTL